MRSFFSIAGLLFSQLVFSANSKLTCEVFESFGDKTNTQKVEVFIDSSHSGTIEEFKLALFSGISGVVTFEKSFGVVRLTDMNTNQVYQSTSNLNTSKDLLSLEVGNISTNENYNGFRVFCQLN